MKFRYKVITKSGQVIHAERVEVNMGFVTMFCCDRELRLPSGEVAQISKLDEVFWENVGIRLGVMFLIVFSAAWTYWTV